MENWIPFADGSYLAERVFVISSNDSAVDLDDTVIEIKTDAAGRRRLLGRGRISNLLMVALLEESDDLDLVLDFGGEFKFRLAEPAIQSGKVFAANVKSMLQFYPKQPWKRLAPEEYAELVSRTTFL